MSTQPDVIEKYLDQVCGYLQMMPEDDVAEIRCELREHLRLSVEDLVANGFDPAAAAGEAVRRFGRTRRVGLDIAMKSPYAWLWSRSPDDEIKIGTFFKLDNLGSFLALLIVILIGFLSGPKISGWTIALFAVPQFVVGLLSGATSIIKTAVEKDFNGASQAIACAARDFDATRFPHWKRRLGLHRLLPALRVAIQYVDRRKLPGVLWLGAGAVVMAFMIRYFYVRDGGDLFPLTIPSLLASQFFGFCAFRVGLHLYIQNRPELGANRGGKDDVESA